MRRLILAALLLIATPASALASLASIPAAESVQQAKENRALIRDYVLKSHLARPVGKPPVPPKDNFGEFAQTMLARMYFRVELDKVSANLLDPSFKPWKAGTDIKTLGPICKRQGDYDFVLMSLVTMAYLDERAGQTLLTPKARQKLRNVLLNQEGTEHHVKFKLDNCPFVKYRDSENHILMTEVSRYLTNQLRVIDRRKAGLSVAAFDNARNGFDQWLLDHMSQFLRQDFDEFNSRPYQAYTLIAFSTLYSYAESPRVKEMARMILDYLSAKSAVQSSGLRRYAPFRRQKQYRDANDLMDRDTAMTWYTALTGTHRYVEIGKGQFNGESYHLTMAAIQDYEVPDMILDLFVDPIAGTEQKFRHRDVEMYYANPEFLISSGGRHRSVFGFGTGENDAWGVASVVIPRNFGLYKSELFRIEGDVDWGDKSNLCVANGFLCGERPAVPANVPPNCKIQKGAWTFYDMNACSMRMGFYVALYRQKDLGFMEVRAPDVTFANFMDTVLANNARSITLKKKKIASYRTSDGRKITFVPETGKKNLSSILSIDGRKFDIETERWKFAEGTVINSRAQGLVEIHNPRLKETLILDARNARNPLRSQR